MTRRLVAGTGWKMNLNASETKAYAEALLARVSPEDLNAIDAYVLPPFTSLPAAKAAFGDSSVAFGAQNMHWEDSGSWTGEISAPMLTEAGCSYVALAHSERLAHFGETYERVGLKINAALKHGLKPILCLGESADEKQDGRTDEVLTSQVEIALAQVNAAQLPEVILAYEPRWAISSSEAAEPAYIADRHAMLRALLMTHFGDEAAQATRIVYGGSVNPDNGRDIIAIPNVDGLFVGRAAWTAEGFSKIIEIVAAAAQDEQD